VASAHGGPHLLAGALSAARGAGVDPKAALVIVRADSAFYGHALVSAARRGGAQFSITARMDPAVRAAITTIGEDSWAAIHYPNAFFDPDTGELISDAQVAETPFTAFTGRRKADHVTGRLIVRRIARLGPPPSADGGAQSELFTAWRYHAVFTDSPMTMLQAEAQHRGHAIIEQVIVDLKNGPLAHLPSGKFNANAAWLVLATIAFNITRAAGTLASTFHAKATGATIRSQLINVPARIASSARNLTLHLPTEWPWAAAWDGLFTAAVRPPPAAA
jgi:hypothetical protein